MTVFSAILLFVLGLAAWAATERYYEQNLAPAASIEGRVIPKREFQRIHLNVGNWDHAQIPAWTSWELVFITGRGARSVNLQERKAAVEAARSLSKLLGVPLKFRRTATDMGSGNQVRSESFTLEEYDAWAAKFPHAQQ